MAIHSLLDLGGQLADRCPLRVRFRSDVRVERPQPSVAELWHPWGGHRVPASDAVLSFLERMAAEGVELNSIAVDDGPVELAQVLWVLDTFEFLVAIEVLRDGSLVAFVEPAALDAEFGPLVDNVADQPLSRFAFVQAAEGGAVVESAVAAYRVTISAEWLGRLLPGLLVDPPKADPSAGDVSSALRSTLGVVGLLEAAEPLGRDGQSEGQELRRMGEMHDLLLHRRSRWGRWDGAFGAAFPYLGSIGPPEPVPVPSGGELITLPVPAWPDVVARDGSFTEVLERRASARKPGLAPLSMPQLGEFLFRCARVRGTYGPHPDSGLPYVAVDRPFPSGGGMHDLELYLVVREVAGLAPGAYHYMAAQHCLEAQAADSHAIDSLLAGATRATMTADPPQVLIVIASRMVRMAWKYRSITYATILKNVGVLYQTMYLVATAMGLGPCALGSGDDVAADRVLGLTRRCELAVGEFMVSSYGAGWADLPVLHDWP